MNNLLQLSGEVDTRDEEIESLQGQVFDLNQRLTDAQRELVRVRKENAHAIAALRRQLSPLKQALDMVFGEIEAIGGEESTQGDGSSKWDAIKARLAPRLREAVDILLVQKKMSRKQMAAAMHMGYTNCADNVVRKLIAQGLVVDSGGELTLKQL